jgi:hypothetical protein
MRKTGPKSQTLLSAAGHRTESPNGHTVSKSIGYPTHMLIFPVGMRLKRRLEDRAVFDSSSVAPCQAGESSPLSQWLPSPGCDQLELFFAQNCGDSHRRSYVYRRPNSPPLSSQPTLTDPATHAITQVPHQSAYVPYLLSVSLHNCEDPSDSMSLIRGDSSPFEEGYAAIASHPNSELVP